MEGSEEISKQRTGSAGFGYTSRKASQKDRDIWERVAVQLKDSASQLRVGEGQVSASSPMSLARKQWRINKLKNE